jgi:hypothetical protein
MFPVFLTLAVLAVATFALASGRSGQNDGSTRTGGRTGDVAMDGYAPPTVENLAFLPRIFVASVRGEGSGRRFADREMIYTPVSLRIESVLVSKVDVPADAEYLRYGGTAGADTLTASGNMSYTLRVGQRYVFYTEPLRRNGVDDPRTLVINHAMPIDEADGAVIERPEPGRANRRPLPEVVQRVKALAAKTKWPLAPNP